MSKPPLDQETLNEMVSDVCSRGGYSSDELAPIHDVIEQLYRKSWLAEWIYK